jgi:hypothetical protein
VYLIFSLILKVSTLLVAPKRLSLIAESLLTSAKISSLSKGVMNVLFRRLIIFEES